jgi:hypothetical protein
MIAKAGICVAYDWLLLEQSLPALYPYVQKICLSVDIDRKSWGGNIFSFDKEALVKLVEGIDKEKKIFLLEEIFFDPTRTPIQNECYQRKRMADVLGECDWVVQIDADEVFINIGEFITALKKYKQETRALNIHGIWVNLIKQVPEGYIYSIVKTPPLACNKPAYEYGRTNGHFNIYTNSFLAHITWARPEEEVYYKLKNWGHSHEFNGESFYKIWKALDDFNWQYIKNFHPMNTSSIPQLYFQKAKNLDEFVKRFSIKDHLLGKKELLNNNIWVSRFKKLIHKSI